LRSRTRTIDELAFVVKQDAMVLRSQAGHGRISAPERLDVPGFGLGVAPERVQNLERDGLFDGADIRFGLVGPGDAFGHGSGTRLAGQRLVTHAFPVFRTHAQFGQHLLMRDGFVMLQPLLGFGNGLTLRWAEGVVFVHHDLEQMNDSGELTRRELIEQFNGVLFIHKHS
jgi:hypothetical protein